MESGKREAKAPPLSNYPTTCSCTSPRSEKRSDRFMKTVSDWLSSDPTVCDDDDKF